MPISPVATARATSYRSPETRASTELFTQQRRENEVTLALLRSGLPSSTVLAAKTLDDMLSVAMEHDVPVPETCRSRSSTGSEYQSDDDDDESYDGRCTRERYTTPPSSALRGRSWRQYYYQTQQPANPPSAAEEFEIDRETTPGTYDGERNEEGERHGHGVYRFADGGVFDGQWSNNLQEVRRRLPHRTCHARTRTRTHTHAHTQRERERERRVHGSV